MNCTAGSNKIKAAGLGGLQVYGDSAVFEVLFHLVYSVALEVGD